MKDHSERRQKAMDIIKEGLDQRDKDPLRMVEEAPTPKTAVEVKPAEIVQIQFSDILDNIYQQDSQN